MTALTPKLAAGIASKVYEVRDQEDWSDIAKRGASIVDTTLDIDGNFTVDTAKGRFNGTSGGNFLRAKSGFGYIASGVGTRQNEVLIAIRGTVTAYDWVTDAMQSVKIGPSGYPVHAGFETTFESFQSALRDFLGSNSKPTTVHVVGHSLGGALATLTADYLTQQHIHARLYTFGCPRTGFESFSRNLTRKMGAENIFRVHHSADPVTMVPIFPFIHAPLNDDGYMLPWEGAPVSFGAHKMGNYINSIGDSTWTAMKRAPVPGTWGQVENWLDAASKQGNVVKMYSAKTLWMIMKSMEWILDMIGYGIGLELLGAVTVVDMIAKVLYQGTLASVKIGSYVVSLINAIMRFLGRTVITGVSLTVSLFSWVLKLLFNFISSTAQLALQKLHQ